MSIVKQKVSIIIPAKNEEAGLALFLTKLRQSFPSFEIIVVNDGSTDNTAQIAQVAGTILVNHPYSIGNGASIKSGARIATGEILIFMDADGQHQIEDIMPLLTKYLEGYDMVVGARNKNAQASRYRGLANAFGNRLASLIVGHKIADLTSGFRIVDANKFKEFIHLFPNGFSTPTTITMAFFRSGYCVAYQPIHALPRLGKSHLRPLTESFRFLLIIYKMTVLYSPLKIFLPLALFHFIAGIANYAYTYATFGRFTNMSAVLISASVIIFLIGLISEQITALMYSHCNIVKVDKKIQKKPITKSQVPKNELRQ